MKAIMRFRIIPLALFAALLIALLGSSSAAFAQSGNGKDSPSAPQSFFTVDDLGDAHDANVGDGDCATAAGKCTLRAALEEGNSNSAGDFINFSVAGTIHASSNIDITSAGTIINGASQEPNTGVPGVVLEGPGIASGSAGLRIQANNVWINGLTIRKWTFGILIAGNNAQIGSNENGTNDSHERCIISGNQVGIFANGLNASNALIANNFIGTNVNGTTPDPNTNAGIFLTTHDNRITRNTISGNDLSANNGGTGIYITGNSYNNWIYGNNIGITYVTNESLPNVRGIWLHNGPNNNIIGSNQDGVDDNAEINTISGNTYIGVELDGDNTVNNHIAWNVIGPSGNNIFPSQRGVVIDNFAANNYITRNTISGHSQTSNTLDYVGSAIYLHTTGGNRIQGNYLGVMPDGNTPAPNKYAIFLTTGATNNLIGTDADGQNDYYETNYIAGNDLGAGNPVAYGILMVGANMHDNVVRGNKIGVRLDGTALGNRVGIGLYARSNYVGSNLDGSNDETEANEIANNTGEGVVVVSERYNTVVANSIHDNAGLGIDLANNGPSANDPGDGDSGANELQNSPRLLSVVNNTVNLSVRFVVDSATTKAAYPLYVDLYEADAPFASGQFAEGKHWLGRLEYSEAEAQQQVTRTFQPQGAFANGMGLVATATDSDGNTSEFSAMAQVVAPATPTPTATATPPGGCSISFSDVHASDYFYEPVRYLFCGGIISGYADGTFRPYNNTTRGQLTKIVSLGMGWQVDTSGGPHFSDVQPSDTFYSYIETAYHHNVIAGYADGTFRPGNNVTRGQLSKIIVLAKGWTVSNGGTAHFNDVPSGSTFFSFVEAAYAHGIISGYADGTFRPGNNATRGQISKIAHGALTQP